jgi:hypothetical protein
LRRRLVNGLRRERERRQRAGKCDHGRDCRTHGVRTIAAPIALV